MDIDAVITWVDGNDPEHRRKRRSFDGSGEASGRDDLGGDTRFASVGEIAYCVALLAKNAPFLRRIYIVTDGQTPPLFDLPEGVDVRIVDHRDIFRGYEQYLPVFNSLSIETMLWRIPGLANRFIYLNDDFFMVRPTVADDFFNPAPVIRGYWHITETARLCRTWSRLRHGRKGAPFLFRDSMLNSADLLRAPRFVRLQHVPYVIYKPLLQAYYELHPEALTGNISHRFRHSAQHNPQELAYLLALRHFPEMEVGEWQKCRMDIVLNKQHLMDSYLERLNHDPELKFVCVNSLDQFSEANQQRLLNALGELCAGDVPAARV